MKQPECTASISGRCLAEYQSETACDTDAGECVHGGRPAAGRQSDQLTIQCADAFWLKTPHAPHDWQQRPDALPVRCRGVAAEEQAAQRVKHSGPDTKFCVLCLSGEHERVDERHLPEWPGDGGRPSAIVEMSVELYIEMGEQLKRLRAERDQARRIAVTLEQQNARALELLEAAQMREVTLEQICSGRYSINDQRTASLVLTAVRVLRGDDE